MVPSKGFYLPFSKLHSILAVANLLAHNNLGRNGQAKTFGGTFYFAVDEWWYTRIFMNENIVFLNIINKEGQLILKNEQYI